MTNNFNINLYKKSQQNSNLTKTPHEVVRFLMENLLNSMKSLQSTLEITKGSDIENLTKKQLASFQSKNTSKALTIIYSLQVSLDFDKSPKIAQNLFQIYEYCRVQIINALLKKTKTGLVKAIEVLNDILDGWSNINPRKENA
tara:strand:+ start:96 stop:524 length:429 start_codon:yes stop_codon:yes gene_type:complete